MSIQESISTLFEDNRIVVWYDKDKEFTEEFNSLSIPDVEKIEVQKNEFYVKYKILYENPQNKFLLYIPSERPDNEQNWLLDVELANTIYATDEVSQILQSLNNKTEYRRLVQNHLEFFKGKTKKESNLEQIRDLFDFNPSEDRLCNSMLYIACESDGNFSSVLEKLFIELSKESRTLYNRIEKYSLKDFFWEQVQNGYGYQSENPNLQDFFHGMFLYAYYFTLDPDKVPKGYTPDALTFVKQIKFSRQPQLSEAFRTFTENIFDAAIADDVENRSIDEFDDQDIFREIDNRIINELTDGLFNRTLKSSDCQRIIQARKQTLWFESDFEADYMALEYAAQFFQLLSEFQVDFVSPDNAFSQYASSLYQIDQTYRLFNYNFMKAKKESEIWVQLHNLIDRHYINGFVEKLNNAWHDQVVKLTQWNLSGVQSQFNFFENCVEKKLAISNGTPQKRVYVIISDALRYEIAAQLCDQIKCEKRLNAEIQPMLGALPSITRLGMAAMLPHKTPLEFYMGADNSLQVKCDNLPTSNTQQRQDALNAYNPQIKAIAINSSALPKTRDNAREKFKSNVIYIYHDIIDKRSHSETSPGEVFKTAQEAISELIELVQKLVKFEAHKIIITADHGFLYQESEVQELSVKPSGAILESKPRYVIGGDLEPSESFRSFTAEELQMQGQLQFQFPNSCYRLPFQGSNGRFVHGGYSLQEVVLPIITITPQRGDDRRPVGIEIWTTVDRIVGNVLPFALCQEEPVRNQVQSRKIKVGLYSSLQPDRIALSDVQTYLFDVNSDNKESSTKRFELHLNSQANNFNRQTVFLIVSNFDDDNETVVYRQLQLVRTLMEHDF